MRAALERVFKELECDSSDTRLKVIEDVADGAAAVRDLKPFHTAACAAFAAQSHLFGEVGAIAALRNALEADMSLDITKRCLGCIVSCKVQEAARLVDAGEMPAPYEPAMAKKEELWQCSLIREVLGWPFARNHADEPAFLNIGVVALPKDFYSSR